MSISHEEAVDVALQSRSSGWLLGAVSMEVIIYYAFGGAYVSTHQRGVVMSVLTSVTSILVFLFFYFTLLLAPKLSIFVRIYNRVNYSCLCKEPRGCELKVSQQVTMSNGVEVARGSKFSFWAMVGGVIRGVFWPWFSLAYIGAFFLALIIEFMYWSIGLCMQKCSDKMKEQPDSINQTASTSRGNESEIPKDADQSIMSQPQPMTPSPAPPQQYPVYQPNAPQYNSQYAGQHNIQPVYPSLQGYQQPPAPIYQPDVPPVQYMPLAMPQPQNPMTDQPPTKQPLMP